MYFFSENFSFQFMQKKDHLLASFFSKYKHKPIKINIHKNFNDLNEGENTHTHTHTHIYIYIYILLKLSFLIHAFHFCYEKNMAFFSLI